MTDSRRKYVRARTWDVVANPDFFPERNDLEIGIAELLDKADLGVCLSGGGTRSASASLGQLRGLREIGLLDKIRYICAVSGGSWTATPFTYLPDSIDDETFLGPRIEPGQINNDDLKYAPDGSMAKAIENSVIADDVIESWVRLRGDESYARAVGDIFLDPFGLDDNEKFFTWNRKSRTAVLNNNSKEIDSDRYLKPEDFYLAREGRPYLIVGATLLYGPSDNHVVVPLEMTPLYLGIRQHVKEKGKNGGDIGGYYVESFAYDSKFNEKDIGTRPFRVKFWSHSILPGGKRYFFTLSDMIGTSGAAPAEKLYERGVTKVGFPEFRPLHFPKNQPHFLDTLTYGKGFSPTSTTNCLPIGVCAPRPVSLRQRYSCAARRLAC